MDAIELSSDAIRADHRRWTGIWLVAALAGLGGAAAMRHRPVLAIALVVLGAVPAIAATAMIARLGRVSARVAENGITVTGVSDPSTSAGIRWSVPAGSWSRRSRRIAATSWFRSTG